MSYDKSGLSLFVLVCLFNGGASEPPTGEEHCDYAGRMFSTTFSSLFERKSFIHCAFVKTGFHRSCVGSLGCYAWRSYLPDDGGWNCLWTSGVRARPVSVCSLVPSSAILYFLLSWQVCAPLLKNGVADNFSVCSVCHGFSGTCGWCHSCLWKILLNPHSLWNTGGAPKWAPLGKGRCANQAC
jgi:hypothetical protein